VFVDFDGTITDRDTFDVLVEIFAGPEVWAQTERGLDDGLATIRDVLQIQAGMVRGSFAEVAALLRRAVTVDPAFPEFVRFCTERNMAVTVVSSGIEPIIRDRLDEVGLPGLPIVANGLDPDPAGWKILYRDGSENGTDKVAIIGEARTRGTQTIYIGDGRSDYAAATLADRPFAKRGRPLERYLREHAIPFEPYTTFADLQSTVSS
jgi:2-hydroxy-3-keto-5-methylthiopentenyl-1-phosphate phosphatase